MRRTPQRTQAAPDADRLVFHHYRAFTLRELKWSQMLQVARLERRFRIQPVGDLIRELDIPQGDQCQAILRTYVHATAAQDAFGSMLFVAIKNRINPALQTPRSFAPRLFLGEPGLHFHDAGASIQRQNGHSD